MSDLETRLRALLANYEAALAQDIAESAERIRVRQAAIADIQRVLASETEGGHHA